MPAHMRLILSLLVHGAVSVLISVAVAHGFTIPEGWAAYVEATLLGLVFAGYGLVAHWLATRTGRSWWARGARLAATVMTLGAGALKALSAKPMAAKP